MELIFFRIFVKSDLKKSNDPSTNSSASIFTYLYISSLKILQSFTKDSLTDSIGNYHMGITAENISAKYSITRGEMDKYAVESHQRATYATEHGSFKNEIVNIVVENSRVRSLIETDENIRPDTNIEKLAKLRSAFKESGVVTAGNSSSINDGASILMLVSEKVLHNL